MSKFQEYLEANNQKSTSSKDVIKLKKVLDILRTVISEETKQEIIKDYDNGELTKSGYKSIEINYDGLSIGYLSFNLNKVKNFTLNSITLDTSMKIKAVEHSMASIGMLTNIINMK